MSIRDEVIRSRGHIVYTQLVGDDDENNYGRWVSTGQREGRSPVYSVQRFNYSTDNRGRRAVPTDPYYRVYKHGFVLRFPATKLEIFKTLTDAWTCAERDLFGPPRDRDTGAYINDATTNHRDDDDRSCYG